MSGPNDIANSEQESMNSWENAQTDLARAQHAVPNGAARTTSDFVRNNPGLSPDAAAATMYAASLRDNPGIAEVIRADYHGQGILMRTLNNTVGRVTRPLTAGFYDVWDMSTSHWQRFAVQQYQNPDDSWATNWGRAGVGIAGEVALDEETNMGDVLFGSALGTGMIAGRPDDPLMMPGAGTHLENQLKQEVPFNEAISNTEEWVAEKYKANVVSDAWRLADATRLHVTVDGIEYDYGVSAGRLAVTPLFQLGYVTPHTIPANIISGSIDFYTQIALDPMDPAFIQLTRWASIRKMLRPEGLSTVDEVIAAHGGLKLTEKQLKEGGIAGMTTDDYVFHGGPVFDPEEGLSTSGITQGLEKAVGYANQVPDGAGVVYVIPKNTLPSDVAAYIEKTGDIDRIFITELDEVAQTRVDDLVVRLEKEAIAVEETERELVQFVDNLTSDDPEFMAYMDDRARYLEAEAEGTLAVDDLGIQVDHLEEPDWYITTYLDKETAARYADLKKVKTQRHLERQQGVLNLMGMPENIRHGVGAVLPEFHSPDLLVSPWPIPIESTIPVNAIEDMLVDGYFYPGGENAQKAARYFIDNELGVVKAHGRWEAKDPTQWLEKGRGDALAGWLANPAVPLAAKVRQLASMGVPADTAMVVIDDIERAIRAADLETGVTRWDEPTKALNDFEVPLGPAAPGQSISGRRAIADHVEMLRYDLTGNVLSVEQADELSILLSHYAMVNIDEGKRVRELQRAVSAALRDAESGVKQSDLFGKLDKKLADWQERISGIDAEDAKQLQSSLDRFAGGEPGKATNIEEARAIRAANTEAPVLGKEMAKKLLTDLVNNRNVTKQSKRPGALSRAVSGDTAINSGTAKVRDTPRAFSDWGRRWRAHSSESRIDAWDWDTTFDSVTQFLDTIRSTPETIDRIVRLAWAAQEDGMRGSMRVADELMMELEEQLRRQGVGDDAINRVITEYFEEQKKTTLYHIDRAGNPIGQSDSIYTLERGPGGLEFKVRLDEAINDAEMSIGSVHIPSIRDVRRLTGRTRTTLERMNLHVLSISPTALDRVLDGAAAVWRDFQLLRPGWMMSVIPDEIMRAMAQGHADVLSNPIFAWRIAMMGVGDELPSGAMISEVARLQGGLGAGQAARNIADQPMLAAHAGNTSWEVQKVLDIAGNVTPKGAEHIARNYVRLYQSQLYSALYRHDGDVEATVRWLMEHPEGQNVLDDIATGQGRGAIPDPERRVGRITRRPETEQEALDVERSLRINLESLEAEVLLMTGGDWVRRSETDPRVWVNSAGVTVNDYRGLHPETRRLWTKNQLILEIRRLNKEAGLPTTNLYSTGGQPVRKSDLQARLLEMQGISVDLSKVPVNQTYVTIVQGDGRLKSVIGLGRAEEVSINMRLAVNQAYKRIAKSFGFHQEDTVLVVQTMNPAGDTYRVYKTPNVAKLDVKRNENLIVVDTSKLEPEEYLRIMESMDGESIGQLDFDFDYNPQAMRYVKMDNITTKAEELMYSGDVNRIFDDMEGDDFDELAKFIQNEAFSDGIVPPSRVKGPSKLSDARLANMEDGLIDKLFTYLGQKPSEVLVRNPYSKVKAWEVFADFYLYATPQLQDEIVAAAGKAGIDVNKFEKFVERSRRIQGVAPGKMPVPSKVQLTMAQMEEIAVGRAIQETRDLFFDLSKRGNWADATKLIFPFGDAWWEVLTRWTKLFNPMKAEEFGRPFKNLHRIQQATMGAERSGWFETNEKGERVFRWFPGAALSTAFMSVPEGFQMRNTASMNQMMFIDFSDARSVLAPGMGPYMQIPASVVRPLEGTAVQSWIDWAVFGSFDPGEKDAEGVMNMLFPTWMKKTYQRIQGGAHDDDAASLVVDIANHLYATGDPKYRDVATDQGVKQQLLIDARRIADTYLWVEMVGSAVLPLQPRAVTELVNTTTEGTERVVQLAAVSDDFQFLNGYMETEQARYTVIDWYGEDPTMVAPKSYGVLYRPVTKGGHDFVIDNPDFMDLVPMTAAAFMPLDPGEVFYSREYNRQINSGDRQKLTPEESFLYLSYRQGQARFYEVKDEMERRLDQAELMWGKDTDKYRRYRDEKVKPWYANAKMSLETMYYGYSTSASGATKLRRRPTSEDLLLEMLAIGTLGSSENAAARNANSELTSYIEQIARLWEKNNQIAIMEGYDASWWYSSSTKTDPTPQMLRDTFQDRLIRLTASITDPEMGQRVKWYTDSIVTPLMQGYDLDSPFIVYVDPLLAPEG